MQKLTVLLWQGFKKKADRFACLKNLFKAKQSSLKEGKQLKGKLLSYRRKKNDPIF